jgi:hypothetical protein
VRFRSPEGDREVYLEVGDGPPSSSGEVGLALGLLPAMWFGGSLEVGGSVPGPLLSAVSRVQEVFLSWDRAGAIRPVGLRPVEVRAVSSPPAGPRAAGVGCFFSGGVDSFYTLIKHRREITDLVVVHGFDVPLSAGSLRRSLSEAAGDVARALGKRVIEVVTDARSLGEWKVTWNHYFGCVLVAVAYGLAARLGRVYQGTGHTYANLLPDGAHPILDAPWSQGPVEIVSDGAESTRTQKLAVLADDPLAMRWLRVCWENREGTYNCGRCEKCLRTQVALHAVGALERCRTMPHALELGALCGVRFGSVGFMWREMLRDLEIMNADPTVVRAVRRALRPGLVREMVWGWYRAKRALRRATGRRA